MYTKEYVHTTHDVIHPKNKYINNTHESYKFTCNNVLKKKFTEATTLG